MKNNDRILNEFISEVHQRFGHHLKKIILFGSRARGDYSPDSDYDCLLIFDNVSPLLIDGIDDITADPCFFKGKSLLLFSLYYDILDIWNFLKISLKY